MNGVKISLEDLFGSRNININTPIIILRNVSNEYLLRVSPTNDVAELNIERLYRDLVKRVQFIDRFVPLGQIRVSPTKKSYTVPMANVRMIHTTKTFEEIKPNVWVGIVRKNDSESRTLGTILSVRTPKTEYPVFPAQFLKMDNTQPEDLDAESEIFRDVYSDESFGRWILNPYKFNVDKTHLKMIDSTGEISNMYIPKPITPNDVIDVGYGDDSYKRKVYFTAQGNIVSDTNCVPPLDNMNKMTLNECNASSRVSGVVTLRRAESTPESPDFRVTANDDDPLTLSLNDDAGLILDGRKSRRTPVRETYNQKLFKKGKKLILKERDEPWFADTEIVGTLASVTDPHKVTGMIDGSPIHTIGTLYGDTDEQNSPYVTDCAGSDPAPGYSRYEKAKKCFNERFEGDEASYMDYVNNVVMYVMCIVILMLMLYKFTEKR